MNHMEETERRVIQEWIEYLEDDASLEAQQAYCQGYVDCIFLLSDMSKKITGQSIWLSAGNDGGSIDGHIL